MNSLHSEMIPVTFFRRSRRNTINVFGLLHISLPQVEYEVTISIFPWCKGNSVTSLMSSEAPLSLQNLMLFKAGLMLHSFNKNHTDTGRNLSRRGRVNCMVSGACF